jgi:hypothetical protein
VKKYLGKFFGKLENIPIYEKKISEKIWEIGNCL